MSAAKTLPAMQTKPKFVFFTDYDGTITQQDSNDFLGDEYGYGQAKRLEDTAAVLEDRMQFRELFEKMMHSVPLSQSQCIDHLLSNITLDPGFAKFFTYAQSVNIPIVVLSSGVAPFIRALLEKLVGKTDAIQIVSNDLVPRKDVAKKQGDERDWEVVFHDESHFGHDKSLEIRPYRELSDGERPYMFYAGDGVSDLSAARETDLLFAKKGKVLVDYCVKQDVPFTLFDDWSSIHKVVQDIVEGKTTIKQAAQDGHDEYKAMHKS